jgi:uncharacterized membrane protein
MIHKATLNTLLDQIAEFQPTVLQTTLTPDDEAKLREAFGADDI